MLSNLVSTLHHSRLAWQSSAFRITDLPYEIIVNIKRTQHRLIKYAISQSTGKTIFFHTIIFSSKVLVAT